MDAKVEKNNFKFGVYILKIRQKFQNSMTKIEKIESWVWDFL